MQESESDTPPPSSMVTHPTRLRVQAASRAKQRLRPHGAGPVKGSGQCIYLDQFTCAKEFILFN